MMTDPAGLENALYDTVGVVDDSLLDFCRQARDDATSLQDLITTLQKVGLDSDFAAKIWRPSPQPPTTHPGSLDPDKLLLPDPAPDPAPAPPAARLRKLALRKRFLQKEIEGYDQDIEKYGWENLTENERREISIKREMLRALSPASPGTESSSGDETPKPETQPPTSKHYDFVFDTSQEIDFAEGEVIEGSDGSEGESSDEEDEKQEEEQALPVVQHRKELMALIKQNQFCIIAGETGSGKTTQLPQFLYQDGYSRLGKIAVTQPRRLAAMAVAARVASEMKVKLGTKVGYTVRFDDKSQPSTAIKFLTDGMLMREFLVDPELTQYSVIMIDEAHERTLQTDVLMALIKDIAVTRPELRIIISSATMNSQKFSSYFNDAPVYTVPGRRYAVDTLYTKQPEANYIQAALMTVFQIHVTQGPGDILMFLPGQEEIEAMAENLLETKRKLGGSIKELIICPIYANMPPEQQARIFDPTPENARKVVVATNIAETSITIDGIVYVIDPGFVKEKVYNPRTGMESLTVRECSQASANQRAGRAGRVGPGKCFRLYTKWSFQNELPKETKPEVLRTNLASVVLMLMSLGIANVLKFDFIDSPAPESIVKALELLYSLGALNEKAQLTKLGRQMAEFPTDPMMAKTILASGRLKCSEEVVTIIAMLGEFGSLFYRPKAKKTEADSAHGAFKRPEGDQFMLLEVWNQWSNAGRSFQWSRDHFVQQRTLQRAKDVRAQLVRLCKRIGVEMASSSTPSDIQKAIIAGYFPNTARLAHGDSYLTYRLKQSVFIHPSSSLHDVKPAHKYVLYHELVLTSKEFMRGVMAIDLDWLESEAPHFAKSVTK